VPAGDGWGSDSEKAPRENEKRHGVMPCCDASDRWPESYVVCGSPTIHAPDRSVLGVIMFSISLVVD